MTSDIKKQIYATGYMKLVRMFAESAGLPFFTLREMLLARRLYEGFAAINN